MVSGVLGSLAHGSGFYAQQCTNWGLLKKPTLLFSLLRPPASSDYILQNVADLNPQ